MPRRVRRPADKEHLFRSLTEGEDAVFKTYKDLMICAASVGYANRKRRAFEKSLEPIAWNIFSGPTDTALVNAIALAECESLDILLENDDAYDQKLTIFEEYANGGLEIINQRVLEAPGSSLENILDYIFEHSPDRPEPPDFDILQKLARQIRG